MNNSIERKIRHRHNNNMTEHYFYIVNNVEANFFLSTKAF